MDLNIYNSFEQQQTWPLVHSTENNQLSPFMAFLKLNYLGIQDPFGAHAIDQWDRAHQTLAEIGHLESNWDGYGGIAPGRVVTENAALVLTALSRAPAYISVPELCPTSGGTISLSWESDGVEIYMEIGQSKYAGYIKTRSTPTSYLDGKVAEIDFDFTMAIFYALNQDVLEQAYSQDYELPVAA